jgi:hypothetical protein
MEGYFLAKPQWVAPPHFSPSVKQPDFKQLLNFASQLAPPPRPSHVDFHELHDPPAARTIGFVLCSTRWISVPVARAIGDESDTARPTKSVNFTAKLLMKKPNSNLLAARRVKVVEAAFRLYCRIGRALAGASFCGDWGCDRKHRTCTK